MKTPIKTRGLWAVALLASALTASAITATYYVDMSVQIAIGNFNPATDQVFVFGNFSDPPFQQTATDGSTNYILAPTGTNANVYAGTFTLATNAPGSFENHQFVMNPGENFGALVYEPNANFGAGGNRFFTVPTTNTNLPTVFFNDVTNVNQLVTTPVTFYVDLSVQKTLLNFNPATDFVVVAGDWMLGNWNNDVGSAPSMTPTGTNANVYQGTVQITNTVGNLENYKFVILSQTLGNEWEGNVGPGGASGNRQFVFPSVATNIPTVFFNNQSNANVSVTVTFQVNVVVENALGAFTPGVDTVDVAGQFNNWVVTANPLTQSPSNPDLYTGTATIGGYSPGATVNYKYTIDGQTLWENNNVGPGGGQNRQFIVPTTVSTNLGQDFFNNYANLGTLSVSNNHAGQAIIKWPMPGTRIRLQSSGNLGGAWTDVANTLGSNSATVTISGQTMYRVKGP